ncbi:MAG: CDP-glycerol glycerophosphotransferase family protein [Selenomonadaceae bacterium]|nr:CDP-glycerol glycerophosphotransferase family protein [Selenomonadaceae bacterium]
MEKTDIILVVLNEEFLESTLKNLNFDNVNIEMILANNEADEKFLLFDDKKIPLNSFSRLEFYIKTYKDFIWLISGYVNGVSDLDKMKKFLMMSGVPEDNIVNFEVTSQISRTWLANLHYIAENGADFFATGNDYMRDDLNLKLIPNLSGDKNLGGVNLADTAQDLFQSYLTAKYVFEHVKRGTIKFVLIGLAPYSFRYDNAKDFANCAKGLQYMSLFTINFARMNFSADSSPEENPQYMAFFNYPEPNSYSRHMDIFLDNEVKNIFTATTSEGADLNYDAIKELNDRNFPAQAITDWKDDTPALTVEAIEKNVRILEDYIKLCLDNGAKPIGVVFPFAPIVRRNYDQELLASFRERIRYFESYYDFDCFDMFELVLNYNNFCDITHLNFNGMTSANALIAFNLYLKNFIPFENFYGLSYEYFRRLAWITPKDEYNDFMDKVLKISVEKIRRKDKVKVAFVGIEAAQWCGEDLYNFFAQDERFETSVFLSMDFHKEINDLVTKDFRHGVEQLRNHGLEVIALEDKEDVIPEQDLIILLTPYINWLPYHFLPTNMTIKTLLVHIPYAFDSALHKKDFYNKFLFILAWKMFFSSIIGFEIYERKTITGMPRGIYSGYPKMDIFFKSDADFHFNWKMTRPNAKKIIWAPHHSIKGGPAIKFATFQWNYQFMYEFAKNHPEISWVVKPHPMLLYTAVEEQIFPSETACEDYFQKWNELPNAQVYTGAYYQAIFATSDGMIHDCASFISEYQFVNKPMIYLTRDTQWHNELGKKILDVSYLVNGQDLEAIAATLQSVFIEGKDDKAKDRKKVFDKYLNYFEFNGMLASEFIYKNIADELKKDDGLTE